MPPKEKSTAVVVTGQSAEQLAPNVREAVAAAVQGVGKLGPDVVVTGAGQAAVVSGADNGVDPSIVSGAPAVDPLAGLEPTIIGVDMGREVSGAGDLARGTIFDTFVGGPLAAAIEKATADYPKLTMLFQAHAASGQRPFGYRIVSSVDGLRRGGVRHPRGSSEYELDAFAPQQLETMLNEPALTVELI